MNRKLSSDTWEAMMRAHATMMRCFQEAGNWKTVSMREYDVLYTLAKAGCSMNQKALLEGVLLSQPALSRLLNRLIEQGLIERGEDPADGRGILIRLTEKGREVQRQVGRIHAETIAQRLGATLSEHDMNTLRTLALAIAKGPRDDGR
ncbi:MarR family transcriptional regulator [Actinomycetaceae bacterium WB03_NA08]|uniref:MarR family transcriptional regulator n=1 Tax=Scrofimicrobium canadense TaxID=2652290 RepID=A0A6N7W6D6_9ACTO|nr:MarR family transcriptional regulator [Scrofimicrobium canadense]MSS84053.1 MarR family transcriptional regulator [Scrofimicrobium canadense]